MQFLMYFCGMTTTDLSGFIKDQALKLGFDACGIAKATRIPESEIASFHFWLNQNFHAGMRYMENHSTMRYDPRLLVKGCRSVVVVAMNYEPAEKQTPDAPKIARFAYGKDYHAVIRRKLQKLLQLINEQGHVVHGRAFADSAPVAERFWAVQSGLGWTGKNHQLILPQKGSYFFLGELMIDIELDYDAPLPNHCGRCRLCLEACPTKALTETSGMDARCCLSYLTIEKRGSFNPQEASLVGKNKYLFGCDICQEVCPWNRFAKGNKIPELQAKPAFLSMKREDYEKMTEKDFDDLFCGTCLERTGYEGVLRNLKANKNARPSI